MKKNSSLSLLILVVLLFSKISAAQENLIQNISSRSILSLNGRWNYIIDPYENGFYDYRREAFDQSKSGKGGYYDDKKPDDKSELVEYDFDHSPALNIPGDWNSQVEKLEFYEGTIWFRNKFTVHPGKGKRYFLYFGAVNYEAHVYLNGKKLGMHKGGFTPFQFDVTGELKDGGNTLVVKADNTRKKDEVPTINTDWWNYGGITRDVFIAETPSSFISDYLIQLSKGGLKDINGFVQLSGVNKVQKVTVDIPEAKIKTTVLTDANGRASLKIPANNLTYWTPENPKLYAVNISVAGDTVTDRIGFRSIITRGKDVLLNGKPVFLRGISIHDENPLIPGRARSKGDLKMLLSWAKELNCNFVRLAHYPHNEQMVRLADEMGLMVWAEVPVYWTIAWDNPETYKNAENQMSTLITRDKNRASVIVWSIGNETPLSDPRYKFMSNMAAHVRSLDNTRLVAAALEVHRKGTEVIVDDPLGEKLDLTSFNEYGAWYWGGTPKELSKYRFNIKYNKPVVITEFGGDALAGFHGDEDTRWTEEYQEALYRNQLALLNTIDGLRGMTPWILADFKSPRRPHSLYQNFWNRKGLISNTGVKKKAFFILKNFYNETEKKYNGEKYEAHN